MKPMIDYSLYIVTDSKLMSANTLESAVEQSILGGCTLVQLREKDLSTLDFYNSAVKIKCICDKFNVPLIINDRVDVALAVDSAGIHIGQSDLPTREVRKIIGSDKIVGVSVSHITEALSAVKDGADYLGVGAMFATATKTNTRSVSIEELKEIKSAVNVPIVVIGGINTETIPLFKGIGIDGFAVVTAIISQADIKLAAVKLKALLKTL